MTEISQPLAIDELFWNNGVAVTGAGLPLATDPTGGSSNDTDKRFVPNPSGDAQLDLTYAVFEGLVALMAVVGNAMVIVVFKRERRLRRRTNFYIVSLAVADFLVGLLGVPFAVLSSVGLPRNLHACLFTISLLIVLCTISIFCLVAVSVDRYWAILHPMAYSRNVRTKTAIVIISLCWLAGSIIGFLPLFGWHETPQVDTCLFLKVMDYDYLVFLYFATIITPALIMLAFYAHIYRVIVKQLRQIVTMNPSGGLSSESRRSSESSRIRVTATGGRCKPRGAGGHGGTMLRVLGAAQKREVKATQNLSIIVLFFMICWIPLYTINCIVAFCRDCKIPPTLMLFCIILSHLNSAVNPLLYAYHLKDFRAALRNLILSMLGYDVTTQELNYRASLASQQQQFAQRHSIMDKRLSLQPKVYIDSPVYHRAQQQLRRQQSQLLQQRSLDRSESGASVQSMNKKRLVSSTRSDPGSPNVIVSTSAIPASPAESNCSTPQRALGGGIGGTYEMWGIAEVSSINEDSATHRKSLDDDNRNGLVLVCTTDNSTEEHNDESGPEKVSLEVDFEDIGKQPSPLDGGEVPELRTTAEEDRNVSSLYSIVTSKRRSHSTCCILHEATDDGPEAMTTTPDSVYLIENDSPIRILANHGSQQRQNNNNRCTEDCANRCILNLVDSFNNNQNQNHTHHHLVVSSSRHCKHSSSPNFSSVGAAVNTVNSSSRDLKPISKSFSLFANASGPRSPGVSSSTGAAAVTGPATTSHSSLFKLFASSGTKQRMRSIKFNRRSLSNDK